MQCHRVFSRDEAPPYIRPSVGPSISLWSLSCFDLIHVGVTNVVYTALFYVIE